MSLNDLMQYVAQPLSSSSVPRRSAELNNTMPNITKSGERKKRQDMLKGEEDLFLAKV